MYFRVRNRAYGPHIVYFGGLNELLLPQNRMEKVRGFATTFPMGFAVGRGRLDPKMDDFRRGMSIAQHLETLRVAEVVPHLGLPVQRPILTRT